MAFPLFPLTTVCSTNVYRSRVWSGKERRNVLAFLEHVNGSTGNLQRQHNNMTEAEYAVACGFAMEESAAAREAKEAANDVGWRGVPWRESDNPGGSATKDEAMASLTTANTVSASFAPGPARERFVFTNTLNSGSLKILGESHA